MKLRNAAWKIENSRIAKYVGHFGGLKIVEFESLGEWDSFHPSQRGENHETLEPQLPRNN